MVILTTLILVLIGGYFIHKKFFSTALKKPEIEKWWTTLYFGPRGSGKTLHQAKVAIEIFDYLSDLYAKKPGLRKAFVFSIQRFSPEIEKKYLGTLLYYWNDAKDLRYCPRKDCWQKKAKHRLHGCYIIFDDIATILPADNWNKTPIWLRKTFAQGRHFGIRILANCQDPFSCDVNFRRYCDMGFRFRKIIGSRDPDETKPPVTRIWGIYVRRRIKAEDLWKFGDMSDEEISQFKAKVEQQNKINNTHFYKDIWRSSPHWIGRKICSIYDTTQDVPEYKPTGYEHEELGCIDPKHDHLDKKAPNYCGYSKVSHTLV